MPELPLIDSDGKLLPYAPFVLLAYTTYPYDELKFEELLASGLVQHVLSEEDASEDDRNAALLDLTAGNPWIIPALHRGPAPKEILEAAMQSDASAWAAGEILLTMLCVSSFHPEIPLTVKMTVECISEFQRETGQVAASESTLWNSWGRFKSVAHFHAVRQGWMAADDVPPEPEYFVAWRMVEFDTYLACAEHYRKLAVSKRLVKFKEFWRVPDNLQLPPAAIELGPLLPELLEIFLRYHAT